jgi:hypothetical protein
MARIPTKIFRLDLAAKSNNTTRNGNYRQAKKNNDTMLFN